MTWLVASGRLESSGSQRAHSDVSHFSLISRVARGPGGSVSALAGVS